jgi:hypothetical protein
MVILGLAVGRPAFTAAQQILDSVIVRFGSEIVTQLDVRQARMLRLVAAPNGSDEAYAEALVNRRLVLAEIRRSPPPEPSPDAMAAERRAWEGRVGAGAGTADLLARAGMTEAALLGWLRDDVRMRTYVAGRFGERSADLASWIGVLRQRAGQ